MLTPFFEARAWRIATQLIRRAPTKLALLEGEFGDGHYILNCVVRQDAASPMDAYATRLVDVNRHGTSIDSPHRPLPAGLESAGRDLTLLFDRAPAFYQRLAAHLGIPDPKPLPASTPQTLAFRFIVGWLQLHSTLGHAYACWQGIDSALNVRAHYFTAFQKPELRALGTHRAVDGRRWHAEYGYWFIAERDEPPVACLDSGGQLYAPDGASFDINALYRESGHDIWAPISAVRSYLDNLGVIPAS